MIQLGRRPSSHALNSGIYSLRALRINVPDGMLEDHGWVIHRVSLVSPHACVRSPNLVNQVQCGRLLPCHRRQTVLELWIPRSADCQLCREPDRPHFHSLRLRCACFQAVIHDPELTVRPTVTYRQPKATLRSHSAPTHPTRCGKLRETNSNGESLATNAQSDQHALFDVLPKAEWWIHVRIPQPHVLALPD